MTYRRILPDAIVNPSELQPAIAFNLSMPELLDRLDFLPTDATVNDDQLVLALTVDERPLVLLSYVEEPAVLHLFLHDEVARRVDVVLDMIARLPLQGVRAGWWTRADQSDWPGNHTPPWVVPGTW